MKHVSQFLLVSSLSLIAFSGQSSLLASSTDNLNGNFNNELPGLNDESIVNVPARPQKIAAPSERANRKPAVEARVYVEDPSHPSALYYYDYKDQRPEQGQNPPLQPSTF